MTVCKHCDKEVVLIEGSWYHKTDSSHRVQESCDRREPLPKAEPEYER